MPSGPDEIALVTKARQGCPNAFADLYERYYSRIFAICVTMLKDREVAEDTTQNSFLKASQAITTVDPTKPLNIGAWLYQIAHNSSLDVLRRQRRLHWHRWDDDQHDQLRQVNVDELPEQQMIRSEIVDSVRDVLARMSDSHRTALLLREYEGLGCEEIGLRMGGASRTAVKSRLFRSRQAFKDLYRRLYGKELAA